MENEKEAIGRIVSRAIKEGKWLVIKYINNEGGHTQFWIAVTDINPIEKTLKVSMYNHRKALDIRRPWIKYNNITHASIIEFTSYKRPIKLINQIESNIKNYQWLCYNFYNINILNYYLKCNILDNDPHQTEYKCIEGIDLEILRKTNEYKLNDQQARTIINKLYKEYSNVYKKYLTLAINRLSIDFNYDKKYVICYYVLSFDPHKNTLVLDPTLRFNSSFMIEGRSQSLFNYISMDIDEFTRTYEENEEEYIEIIRKEIMSYRGLINTKPDIMILEREIPIDLSNTFVEIEERFNKKILNPPLKSFFGTMVKEQNVVNVNKEPVLVFNDSIINLGQIRVINNVFKYHVTYVHGPPGTGKTKTILNVVLSALFNNKTVLICSSNNKPIDSIKEQLYMKYNGEIYSLPFLRLGNNKEIENAINIISEMFNIDVRNIHSKINEVNRSIEKDMEYMVVDYYNDDFNSNRNIDLLESLGDELNELQKNFIQYINQYEERLKVIKEIKNYKELLKDFVNENDEYNLQLEEDISKLEYWINVPVENIGENEQRSLIIEIINSIEQKLSNLIPIMDHNDLLLDLINKSVFIEMEFKALGYLPDITNKELLKGLLESLIPYQQPLLEKYFYSRYLQTILNLNSLRYQDIKIICEIKNKDKRVREFNQYISEKENMEKLLKLFPIILSTNISSQKLGTPRTMFDLVIMDEAGQCNIASALIPITKARNLLLVGDPNQLRPIIKLEEKFNRNLMTEYKIRSEYDYRKHSILDVMVTNDKVSNYILLKNHYRCGRKIIDFSNQLYYNKELEFSEVTSEDNLELIMVKNKNNVRVNESIDEALGIINYIIRNNIEDAFIVTPFVNQKKLINKLLLENNLDTIQCGTIHSLQGAEKDTIIFSMAVSTQTSKRTFNWLKNNAELINVAVTRAKSKLIIAADTESIDVLSKLTLNDDKNNTTTTTNNNNNNNNFNNNNNNNNNKSTDKKNQLQMLIDYIKENGNIQTYEEPQIEIGYSNGSRAENEFYKTIYQLCSCNSNMSVRRNVKLHDIFPDIGNENNSEFDVVINISSTDGDYIIVFEVNGGEHIGDPNRERSDRLKMKMLKKTKNKLNFISNYNVLDYKKIQTLIDSQIKQREIDSNNTI